MDIGKMREPGKLKIGKIGTPGSMKAYLLKNKNAKLIEMVKKNPHTWPKE